MPPIKIVWERLCKGCCMSEWSRHHMYRSVSVMSVCTDLVIHAILLLLSFQVLCSQGDLERIKSPAWGIPPLSLTCLCWKERLTLKPYTLPRYTHRNWLWCKPTVSIPWLDLWTLPPSQCHYDLWIIETTLGGANSRDQLKKYRL